MNLLVRWALSTLALYVTVWLGVGLRMPSTNTGAFFLTAAVIGLVNAVIRPMLVVVTFPLTLLTFGLFLFVVNGLTLMIATALTPLQVDGFGGAVVGALVLSVLNVSLSALLKDSGRRR